MTGYLDAGIMIPLKQNKRPKMNSAKFNKAMSKLTKQAQAKFGEGAQLKITMSEQSANDMYKPNGVAWRLFLVKTTARWVNAKKRTFLPPSPETLTWGGFLGGEWV